MLGSDRFSSRYTGLANIDLAAALLGLTPAEIDAKREDIVAFADLGTHIGDPIKNYSSGMIVRLGFAVATSLTPDILITDEVLAVGDESFQKKCIAWMERFLADGGTLVLCSHGMYHVQKLCRNALWLKDGRVARYGSAAACTRPTGVSRTEERGGQGAHHATRGRRGRHLCDHIPRADAQGLDCPRRDAGRTAKCSRPAAACRWLVGVVRADGRRCTASRPTWTARPRALSRTGYAFALTLRVGTPAGQYMVAPTH